MGLSENLLFYRLNNLLYIIADESWSICERMQVRSRMEYGAFATEAGVCVKLDVSKARIMYHVVVDDSWRVSGQLVSYEAYQILNAFADQFV